MSDTGSLPQQDGAFGNQRLASPNGEYNQLAFVIGQLLGQMNVAQLVRVEAVYADPTGPAGLVDVLPLVNQVDGSGTAWPHGTVYGLPFFRASGGGAAFICNPVVGDVGVALFCDRDISSVKANGGAQANPGSFRRFSMADGIYLGGWPSQAAPTKYVRVDETGVEVLGDTSILGALSGDSTADMATEYRVAGTRVVTSQQPNIPAPVGGATIDANARVTIGQILSLLSTHGLMA